MSDTHDGEQNVFDLVVIGSGPGGYVAAIRASQLGMRVACVEKDPTLGGTCLNVGCIPSKALLESSELYYEARHSFSQHGIIAQVGLDLEKMMSRKNRVVKTLTTGVAGLFKKHHIHWARGLGTLLSPTQVQVTASDGTTQRLTARRILIATGSTVIRPRFLQLDAERIITSTEALSLTRVPQKLLVMGAGVIGLELGSVWKRLGAEVEILELQPRILAGMDAGLAADAQKIFAKQGLIFHLGTEVLGASVEGETVQVRVRTDGAERTVSADHLLVCVGRRAYTEGLGLDAVGLTLDAAGRIPVSSHYETAIPGIFAIGDVIPGPMLAHKAEEEGVAAVERMAGVAGHVRYDAIPSVVYTWPELASVGATEEELQQQGQAYAKGVYPFLANGRAKAMNATDGYVKILADRQTDRILGAHVLGPRAGDLIAELVVALELGASAEDVARSSHAHPSLAEAVKEACLAVAGRPLNL